MEILADVFYEKIVSKVEELPDNHDKDRVLEIIEGMFETYGKDREFSAAVLVMGIAFACIAKENGTA
jgi:hypothetical protein